MPAIAAAWSVRLPRQLGDDARPVRHTSPPSRLRSPCVSLCGRGAASGASVIRSVGQRQQAYLGAADVNAPARRMGFHEGARYGLWRRGRSPRLPDAISMRDCRWPRHRFRRVELITMRRCLLIRLGFSAGDFYRIWGDHALAAISI